MDLSWRGCGHRCIPPGKAMRTSLATNSHGAIVNTKLHRATVVDLPEDCAPESLGWRENQGKFIEKEVKPPKAERTEVAEFWLMAAVFCLEVVAGLLLVHWGASK